MDALQPENPGHGVLSLEPGAEGVDPGDVGVRVDHQDPYLVVLRSGLDRQAVDPAPVPARAFDVLVPVGRGRPRLHGLAGLEVRGPLRREGTLPFAQVGLEVHADRLAAARGRLEGLGLPFALVQRQGHSQGVVAAIAPAPALHEAAAQRQLQGPLGREDHPRPILLLGRWARGALGLPLHLAVRGGVGQELRVGVGLRGRGIPAPGAVRRARALGAVRVLLGPAALGPRVPLQLPPPAFRGLLGTALPRARLRARAALPESRLETLDLRPRGARRGAAEREEGALRPDAQDLRPDRGRRRRARAHQPDAPARGPRAHVHVPPARAQQDLRDVRGRPAQRGAGEAPEDGPRRRRRGARRAEHPQGEAPAAPPGQRGAALRREVQGPAPVVAGRLGRLPRQPLAGGLACGLRGHAAHEDPALAAPA